MCSLSRCYYFHCHSLLTKFHIASPLKIPIILSRKANFPIDDVLYIEEPRNTGLPSSVTLPTARKVYLPCHHCHPLQLQLLVFKRMLHCHLQEYSKEFLCLLHYVSSHCSIDRIRDSCPVISNFILICNLDLFYKKGAHLMSMHMRQQL